MGLSRLQGTPGYIGYFGSREGKRTRFNCDHYHRFAECCFRNKRVEPCKSPGRCKHHTENTSVTLLEIENEAKAKATKKSKQLTVNKQIKIGSRVEILNLTTFDRKMITIVEPRDANRAENKIPRTSLLAKNLLGKRIGMIIKYRFDGAMQQYKVMNIEH